MIRKLVAGAVLVFSAMASEASIYEPCSCQYCGAHRTSLCANSYQGGQTTDCSAFFNLVC